MRIPGRDPRRPAQPPRARAKAAQSEEPSPLDPVALTLAVWLGLIACGTGVVRLSENAAAQAALSRQGESMIQKADMSKIYAFGG